VKLLCLFVLLAAAPVALAQKCLQIHGRAVWYRADGFFAIWHVGTHHIFFPVGTPSVELICRYFDCDTVERQPALFADFTVCPTKPYRKGSAQPVIVTKVERPRVVPDWQPLNGRP
jgi:hypothetical protein